MAFKSLETREKLLLTFLVSLRSLLGLADVFGVLLVGLIASAATATISGSEDPKPPLLQVSILESLPQGIPALAILTLAVFATKTLAAIIVTIATTKLIAKIEARNSLLIAKHYMHSDLEQLQGKSKATIQTAILESSTAAFSDYLNSLTVLISEGFLLALITATFFCINPIAAGATTVYFAVLAIILQKTLSKSFDSFGKSQVRHSLRTRELLSDSLDSFREIFVSHSQDYFLRKIRDSRQELSSSKASTTIMASFPRYVIETALIVGVTGLALHQAATNSLVGGAVTIGVFLVGGLRMVASLLPLQNALAFRKLFLGQAELAREVLSEIQHKTQRNLSNTTSESSIPSNNSLAVSISNLTFQYRNATSLSLSNISLQIDPGSFVALIGPSGAGKSTLVDAMLGLLTEISGEIEIFGKPPRLALESNPNLVSYVSQSPALISGTLAENIALGIPKSKIDLIRVRECLKAVHLKELAEELDSGEELSLSDSLSEFSGGQVQRIGLARALYRKPKILVLDEATSALDAESEAAIKKTLDTLRGETTIIMIAHRLSTIQEADVVYVLENGKITAKGTFAEIMLNVPMIANYVELMKIAQP